MKIVHYGDIETAPVQTEGAKGVTIRWLISEADGAPNFAMRLFEVEPEGKTPLHAHSWEHEVFVLEGRGVVWNKGNETAIRAGTAVYVPPDEQHCFKNTGDEKLKFLCLIPIQQ
jgi:quercetin dioxygenase-like cupin family protein